MNAGFIKFLRSEAAEELMRYPSSFTLLAQIAFRARREIPKINPFQMEIGEAMIGDFATIGLSRQQYRDALDNLKEWGYVTTRTTNKGTIAKLCNTDVYDINSGILEPTNQPPNQPASQPPNQPTKEPTNQPLIRKKEKEEERKEASKQATRLSKNEIPADQSALFLIKTFSEYVASIGYPEVDMAMYLLRIQAGAESEGPRDDKGWQRYIQRWLDNDKTSGKLLLRSTGGKPTAGAPNLPRGPRER